MKRCNRFVKTSFTCVELRAKLRDRYPFLVPRLSAFERPCQFLLLVLVEIVPAWRAQQPFKSAGIRGDASFHGRVVTAPIPGFDHGSMLFDRWQLPIERFSRQEIFELRRFGPEVLA